MKTCEVARRLLQCRAGWNDYIGDWADAAGFAESGVRLCGGGERHVSWGGTLRLSLLFAHIHLARRRSSLLPDGTPECSHGCSAGRWPERNPWGATSKGPAPKRAEGAFRSRQIPIDRESSRCPSRGRRSNSGARFHGFRRGATPPVATARDPSGVEDGENDL